MLKYISIFKILQDCTQHENVHRGNKGFICTTNIKAEQPETEKRHQVDSDCHPNNAISNILGGSTDASTVGKDSVQFKPCGRSYSSAKALKDHIKKVQTDPKIFSCHVSKKIKLSMNNYDLA